MARIWVATLVATSLAGHIAHSVASINFGESKVTIAAATVNQYASEAYPSWRRVHPGARCPARLELLTEYTTRRDIKDPWGNDYQLFCGMNGIVVRSLGEDARANTEDDLWSNQ